MVLIQITYCVYLSLSFINNMIINIHKKQNYCREKLSCLHLTEFDNTAQQERKLMPFDIFWRIKVIFYAQSNYKNILLKY